MQKRAQGSLEYLIIIAAVLVVSGVVVLFVSGAAGGGKNSALYSACSESAISCKAKHLANPDDPCNFCDSACSDITSGEELFNGSIVCCKLGNSSGIFEGSPGCGSISCSAGETQTCNTTANCAGIKSCVSSSWGACEDVIGDGCPLSCGDNIIGVTETCDGTNISSVETCATQGFTNGVLACNSTCTGYNTAGCCLSDETLETTCNDGKDNDCDGLVDCGDSNCAANPICTGAPPVAAFTYDCMQPSGGTDIQTSTCDFNATSSNDPDGAIVSYSWKFAGEGTDFKILTQWNFTTQGMREVNLTVTDNKGMTDTETKMVFANNLPALSSAQVNPVLAVSGTTFTYYVVYKDADNKSPSFVTVTADGASTYTMTKQTPTCADYITGCAYIYSMAYYGISTHTFNLNASDGFNATSAGSSGPSTVQCTTAAQCNDGNICTNDFCSSYVCGHSNVGAGTWCANGVNSAYYCSGVKVCTSPYGTAQKCYTITSYACNGAGSCVGTVGSPICSNCPNGCSGGVCSGFCSY